MTQLLKALPYIVITALAVFLGSWLVNYGVNKGRQQVQAEWNQEKEARAEVIRKLQTSYAQLEDKYREESRQSVLRLSQANERHFIAIADIRHEYLGRLRKAEDRVSIYQRQAQSGTTERDSLASHTAKLDAALERGIDLVGRLEATLRLRDEQLIIIGKQLLAERALQTGESNGP